MHKKAIKFIIELHRMKSARNKYHTQSIALEPRVIGQGTVLLALFIPLEA